MERKKNLFPNLIAELARQGISVAALADRMGISRTALYAKLNGATKFTLEDIDDIKSVLSESNTGVTVEYLFQKVEV